METALHLQRYLGARNFCEGRTRLEAKPSNELLFIGRGNSSLRLSPWRKDCTAIGVSHRIIAGSDSPRRRPRKGQTSRPNVPASKGLVPKSRVGTSTQKREKSDNEHRKKPAQTKVGSGDDRDIEYAPGKYLERRVHIENEVDSIVLRSQMLGALINDETEGNGRITGTDDDVTETPTPERFFESKKDEVDGSLFINKHLDVVRSDTEDEAEGVRLTRQLFGGVKSDETEEDGRASFVGGTLSTRRKSLNVVKNDSEKSRTFAETDKHIEKTGKEKPELLYHRETSLPHEPEMEEYSVKKLELNVVMHRRVLENLAEENFSRGYKMFVYPQVVKPGQKIEFFLNRSLSTLKDERDVLIMGAFNDWRWKQFTIRLKKTNLNGDWWYCRLYVPKEAYKINFVFFNGGDVYDNNDNKDFFKYVEGGMDAMAFEDFLLGEKRKKLERLAAEQAERERQAEEEQRKVAERAARKADKAQARMEVGKRREAERQLMKAAVRSVDNVWYIEPYQYKGGDLVIRLFYNRGSGPLVHANQLWIHGGHNNWNDGVSITGRLVHSARTDADWWYVDVVLPDRAVILDWVIADGPPKNAYVYDNNHLQDFHAIVPKRIPEELYWFEEENKIYNKLQEERRLKEVAIHIKAERTERMKSETKSRTIQKILLSQKHIFYTEPVDVQAGSTMTVFYNPSRTVLNGKPEVWFRGSFNHWTHRNGPLPPQRMLPTYGGSLVKATVKVPLDAHTMNFVFSESEDGGIYDNKNGMDYHVPVFGGVAKEPPMHIVHVAVEMAPIAKVGGLGDVVTSLSRAVQDLGHNVDIILPKYDCLNLSNVKGFQFSWSYHWGGTEIKVWYGKVEGLSVYFLEPQNGLFWTGCVYGCGNDAERFGFFCHAALEFLLQGGWNPDILHCHDWSSAPVAWLFKDHYMNCGLSRARVVFTIHNLEFGAEFIGKAMAFSDKATTVSGTYSKEVSGNPAIAPHLHKFHGILNGIDPDIWDPYNDKFIPISYTSENVVEGKRAAKEALQQKLGLKRAEVPLVGIITRLTVQKGIHLIKHAIWRTLERNGQVVLLGSAPDPSIQNDFVNLASHLHSTHGDRVRLCLTYDEPLSHLIYAGADFILVPSIFEPCGLTQLTAMRYGSIPVVRKTGGLYDTVFDVDHDSERAQAQSLEINGFSFDGADNEGVDYALNRAITAWYDCRNWFNSLCKTVMEQDWSWNRPALDYMELYHAARK
ncbi:starch synthase 3, chloroplastic/amyloplastic-like [Macadamia integrifolia]|uniref:starch synthase 3, chloroplastic/amyloplastic-like n=1 Tax=Macadamia integrifolia TaxID=60698 RepID=UPI001C52DB02|nr:starch synthase 3, chloroplastic/amyloplastic-like [Macadamia integrifolia]